jgi:hypothetical protein
MATRRAYSLRKLMLVATVGLTLALLGNSRAYAASPIKIHSPAPDSVVSNMVTTSVKVKPEVAQVAFLIDGTLMASSSSTSFVWDSTLVPNGTYTISAQAYSSSNELLRTVSEKVKVHNHSPTPTATPTTTPHATPTPTPSACVTITSPAPNAAVSGTVPIDTSDLCAGNWYESLYVDGTHVGDFATGQVTFTSTSYANGTHTVEVTSQSVNPGSVVLGSASESLNVESGSPTATPTAVKTATPTATSTPKLATPTATPTSTTHYSMQGPGASLPTEASCVSAVNASPIPENAPWNQNDGTGYNSNVPPAGGVPAYFYANAPCCNEMQSSDFATVDGNYSGSTDDLIRITACKWGIDEDYIRSQAWIESDWHQDCAAAHGGSGCNEGGDLNNPGGDPSDLAITAITPGGVFSEFNGFGDPGGSSDHYDSWSIVQTKVYYGWMTWPMMEESTPFGLDYRYAEMRGCVNGDEYSYYNSQSSAQGTDYQNAVSAARTSPNAASRISGWTNLQYLSYGCIDTHFSGDWFDGDSDSYLTEFLNRLETAPWPGGLQ